MDRERQRQLINVYLNKQLELLTKSNQLTKQYYPQPQPAQGLVQGTLNNVNKTVNGLLNGLLR